MLTTNDNQMALGSRKIKGNNFDNDYIVFLNILSILSQLIVAMLILHKG